MSMTDLSTNQDNSTNWPMHTAWKLGIVVVLVLIFVANAIFSEPKDPVELIVYAYDTQNEILTQGIFPAFKESWEAVHGRNLSIKGVFGPSLTLAGQIVLGAPADVAILSHEQHVNYLKLGKIVREGNMPTVVHRTPLVIVTRPNNPAGIQEFADLSGSGMRLIHADPRSSGAGAWAILAEYGCYLSHSENEAEAVEQLIAIWDNVKMMATSARSAMTIFEFGAGDAFITYEQEARMALARGVDLSIVIPSCTVLVEPMAVIVDKNVSSEEKSVANEFIQYLLSEDGQEIFIQYQLRPVTLSQDSFPELDQTISAQSLGGWSQVYRDLIDQLWNEEIEPNLDLELEVNPYERNGE